MTERYRTTRKKDTDKQQRRKNGKKKPLRKLLDRQIEKNCSAFNCIILNPLETFKCKCEETRQR